MQTCTDQGILFEYYMYPHRVNILYISTLENTDTDKPLIYNPQFSSSLSLFLDHEMCENEMQSPFDAHELSTTLKESSNKAAKAFMKDFSSAGTYEEHYLLPYGGKAIVGIQPFACG